MATGDLIVFDEAKAFLIDGGFEAADDIKVAILDNGTTPTAAFATPALGDFTEVGASGSYTAGGISIGTLGDAVTEASGTMKFDSGTNPSWTQNGSNDNDAWWGLVYNATQAGKEAIAFVELGGPVDMSAGALTITWHGSGLFTLAR